ncbi:MAG: YceI family protein [Bacteroidetes bacterium]|nr:YceI family protein [Bacteroidota bacterium]
MKKAIVAALLVCTAGVAQAQKYMTRTGQVSFFSHTPLENIDAVNNEVSAVIDSKTGNVVFQVPVKSFKFVRALMEEHFNENYMESDKYPRADFSGKITSLSAVNFSANGNYNVTVAGKLTMHGVTKDVSMPAVIAVKGKDIAGQAKFAVIPGDYNIKIPSLVESKIAKQITITVNTMLQQK